MYESIDPSQGTASQMPPTSPWSHGGLPQPQSSWPGIVGTISIVFGSLGLLCYGCNSIMTVASPLMQSIVPPEAQQAQAQGAVLALNIGSYCIGFLLAILLLFSGIGVVQRRRWGRTTSIVWAFLKVALAIIVLALTVILAQDIADQVNQQMQASGQAAPFTMTPELIILFAGVGVLFQLIWPVFILIWFNRARIKDEVATWQ